MHNIQDLAAYGQTTLHGNSRGPGCPLPRRLGLALALYVARRCTGLSLRGLGQAAGPMDHNAVFMNTKRFEQRLAKDKSLAKLVPKLADERQT